MAEETLGVRRGEVSPDGRIALLVADCIGMCDHFPSMMINERHYGDITVSSTRRLLEDIKKAAGS